MVFEPEAAVVRRIFDDHTHRRHSLREIIRRLAADNVASPTGRRGICGTSTLSRLLRNEAYVGRVYINRTEAVPDPRPRWRSRQVPRPHEDWITIAVPADLDDQTFDAAVRVSRDNSQWSHAGLNPANEYGAAWSNTASVRSARTATRCAAATAPGTPPPPTTAATRPDQGRPSRCQPKTVCIALVGTSASPTACASPNPTTRSRHQSRTAPCRCPPDGPGRLL